MESGALAQGTAGQGERPLDVRIIAATNQDLEALVAMGRLRSDLFYRLNVLTLEIPPLSSRKDDVLAISEAMLSRLARSIGLPIPELGPEAQKELLARAWDRELDELECWLARLFATPPALADAQLVPMPSRGIPPEPADAILAAPDRSLRSMEESLIRRVLQEEDQNRSRAARVLGINRATLYNKLRQYGIA